MAITEITTRDTQLEKQRIALDRTALENDGGTLKVSVGSVVECAGAIYEVTGAAETPTGTQQPYEYLFFDPAGPSFVWSPTRGTWTAAKHGWYDGSDRRQCHYYLSDATNDTPNERANVLDNGPPGTIEKITINIGDWNMDLTPNVNIDHGLILSEIREVAVSIMKDDSSARYRIDMQSTIPNGWFYTVATQVYMLRAVAPAMFDSVDFNATSFNRGHIVIWWET